MFAAIVAALILSIPMHGENGSGQDGTAHLTSYGGGTLVVIQLDRWTVGAMQPAHIHPGKCGDFSILPLYPLSSLYEGRAATYVPRPLSFFQSRDSIIEVHRSPQALTRFVSCGTIR